MKKKKCGRAIPLSSDWFDVYGIKEIENDPLSCAFNCATETEEKEADGGKVMRIYLVMRERTSRIPCHYGDSGDYWQTETDVISAHRNTDDARKIIETETFLNGDENVRYYVDYVELKEETDGK